MVWIFARNPKINFLPTDHRAQWILFPAALDAHLHPVVSVDTLFRHEFTLENRLRVARLSLRAAKRVQLRINGSSVELKTTGNWKEFSSGEVLPLLHTGINVIEARVFNDNAPPSLWLLLTTNEVTLASDQTWRSSLTGSAWRDSVSASTPRIPREGNLLAGGERTMAAVAKIWPLWLLLGGIALVVSGVGRYLLKRFATAFRESRWPTIVPFLFIAGLWLALFWNNAGLLSPHTGFDAQSHLDYIKYIQERRALPLPTEGFEMFQPPLYYVLSAATLSSFGLSANDPAGILVLRFLTMLLGFAQFSLVFLSLRLLFPNQIGPPLIGLLLAAFLPMQVYLSHYVTNETLAATLATATLYLGLRFLKTENAPRFGYVWLGLALGLAMLTKATTALLIPPLLLALFAKLAVHRPPFVTWLRTIGVMLVVCFAVCGWHYLRIWMRFGTPIVGNWDALSGFLWWQDPGYHTAVDYVWFGQSLIAPLFSGLAGFADGIYSTLWGDGLCGGWDLVYRPPWNYDLMAGGYLLALVPTLLILIGAGAAVYCYMRRPTADRLLLLGSSAAVLVGIVFMTLNVASYAQVKAFYGLSTLVPLCFFGALGWELITRRHKFLRFVSVLFLFVWASNGLASLWIVRSASQHVYAAQHLRLDHQIEAAEAEAVAAIQADSSNAIAHSVLSSVRNDLGQTSEALKEAERAIELNPSDSAAHLQLAAALAKQGAMEGAISESRRALELGPENAFAYSLLLNCLFQTGRPDQAIDVAREALAVVPLSPELHYNMGLASESKHDFVTASIQFGYAILLRPAWDQAYAKFRAALLSIADGPDAAKQLQEVTALAPDSPRVLGDLTTIRANSSPP